MHTHAQQHTLAQPFTQSASTLRPLSPPTYTGNRRKSCGKRRASQGPRCTSREDDDFEAVMPTQVGRADLKHIAQHIAKYIIVNDYPPFNISTHQIYKVDTGI